MLKEEKIKPYWKARAQKHKARAVGFKSGLLSIQDKNYKMRKDFIFKYCPKKLKTLDYGCGIGRYAEDFENYIGVDITKELLDIAIKNYPDKQFLLLDKPYFLDGIKFDFELFFVASVLQHNSDDMIEKIFQSVAKLKKKNILFSLYENSQANNFHIKARTSDDYANFIKKYFKILNIESYKHIIHNEEHTLTIIKT